MSITSIIAGIEAEVAETFSHLDATEQKVVQSVALLSKFDAKGAYASLQKHSITGILKGADEVLSIVGLFFPPAATADQWVKLLQKGAPALELLAAAYAAGLARGIDYKDPAYNAPAGSDNVSTGA